MDGDLDGLPAPPSYASWILPPGGIAIDRIEELPASDFNGGCGAGGVLVAGKGFGVRTRYSVADDSFEAPSETADSVVAPIFRIEYAGERIFRVCDEHDDGGGDGKGEQMVLSGTCPGKLFASFVDQFYPSVAAGFPDLFEDVIDMIFTEPEVQAYLREMIDRHHPQHLQHPQPAEQPQRPKSTVKFPAHGGKPSPKRHADRRWEGFRGSGWGVLKFRFLSRKEADRQAELRGRMRFI